MTTYPDVHVQLSGRDGNAFAIMGAVSRGLRKAGHPDAAEEWVKDAMNSESYDALLELAVHTVEVS